VRWVGLLLLLSPTTLAAPEAPRYTVVGLRCAVFGVEVRSDIKSQRGRVTIQDRAGRDGVMVVRARDTVGGLALEVWFDSLAVWRETRAGTERGDTDGFLGGRFRGLLTPTGDYRSTAVPFVPAALADLADLGAALDDFFPRLPEEALDPGDVWRGGEGFDLRRVADRDGFTQYRWRKTGRSSDSVRAEAGAVRLEQQILETGQLTWSAALGPAAWYRRIEVKARLPRTAGITQGMISEVHQEIWVSRRADPPLCRSL